MRLRVRSLIAGLTLIALVPALMPALAQRSPESILPPGFGEPSPPTATPAPAPAPSSPAVRRDPDEPQSRTQSTPSESPTPRGTNADGSVSVRNQTDGDTNGDEEGEGDENAPVAELIDLPPAAKRSLDHVGLLAAVDGGMGTNAFGDASGAYLAQLMRSTKAPVASRWVQIVLRRALLSPSNVPDGRNGSDWVADRAWLLVRMGEADNARALVSRVDGENYTSWLYDVAMQSSLASADPAMLCGIADAAAAQSKKASWPLSRAICAGLEGESGTSSALAGQVRDRRQAGGIDVLLAEKAAGAGTNTRRAINIEWDKVDRLTAWRFGLATATAVSIPATLYATAGPQVQAWAARAPLLAPASRLPFAERAAAMGVLSNAALVDLYGAAYDAADPAERAGLAAFGLRTAYSGETSVRLSAIRKLWDGGAGADGAYARLILTARAAARLSPAAFGDNSDRDRAIAAMLSAGLDRQAVRLANGLASNRIGWALLAVGGPQAPFPITANDIDNFDGKRGQMLFAAAAALGRISADDIADLSESMEVPIRQESAWTVAIDRAASAGQRGTVALLAAVGMQTNSWNGVPPAHLYHIVSALSRVGLSGEARMIAAEAITRTQ
jgi:hypothetical protein